MNKQNKIVTNYPVNLTVDEVANLSATLAPVVAACGGGGGGGTPIYYYGDDEYTHIKEDRTIVLTDTVTAKLAQDIPTKVTDLSDSANYLTTAAAEVTYQPKGDYLDSSIYEAASANFATKTELESYATKAELENYQTKGDYLSGNALDNVSGTWNTVTQKLDTTAFSNVSGNFLTEVPAGYATETWVENKHYLSAVPDTYYTKSQTSGADQLAAAFNDILKYNVTGAAGIEITTATDNGTTTFGISMTAEPVVTDTNLSGYNGIAAAPDGSKSGWWNVGLTQDMLNVINGKEDILSFSYDGNTITAINTSAVGKEFDGVVTAGSLSGNGTTNSPLGLVTSAENALNKVNDKIDTTAVEQTYQTKSDMSNYLTISDAATTYQPKGDYATTSDISDMATQTWVGQQGFYTKTSGDNDYAPKSITATVNTLTAASASWNEVSAKLGTAQYANDSATFVTSSNSTIIGTKQYALTTAGWAEVSTPTIPAITAESGISADGYKIGLTNTAIGAITSVSSKVDKPSSLNDKYLVLRTDSNGDVSGWCDFQDQSYSKSEALGTFVATANIDTTTLSGDGKSVSTKLGVKTDVIATTDYVNSSFLPTSGGTVSGDVIVKSSGTNILAVNTTATLMGQSRVNSLTDTTAIGTNWLGVNSLGGGFLKNVQGGNVGALNGTSIQINFAPNGNTAYGNITVDSQGNQSKVVHVPTASYNSMSSFDPTNGPNYMLRKTASGFDIGACVINVTSLPDNTEANTYYFIYDT